jgi:hypothetical protein
VVQHPFVFNCNAERERVIVRYDHGKTGSAINCGAQSSSPRSLSDFQTAKS